MLKVLIKVLVILLLSFTSAHAANIIAVQDKAELYARTLHLNPDYDNLYEYVRLCYWLKLYSSNDWCMNMSLNKRWIGYARTHGLSAYVDAYRNSEKR